MASKFCDGFGYNVVSTIAAAVDTDADAIGHDGHDILTLSPMGCKITREIAGRPHSQTPLQSETYVDMYLLPIFARCFV